MPGDTIWLNDQKTQYVLMSDMEGSPDTVYTRYVSTQKDNFKAKSDFYSGLAFPASILLLALIWIIIRIRFGKSKGWVEIGTRGRNLYDDNNEVIATAVQQEAPAATYLCYEGDELNFSNAELIEILNKRSAYYTTLNPFEKEKFTRRLKLFISRKTFNIHDNSGFKEMPVLLSAAAIQLSFGLENYLLQDFPVINIYPEEFLFVHPTIRFLEGNVSNSSINISWKHFLNGFQIPNDGQNVGLHEMAHAYYYQNLQCGDCEDIQFRHTYYTFEQSGNKVFEQEKQPGYDLYSEYAMKNFQEFWAESVEIFFEKPVILQASYPDLYDAIHTLLNQDPAGRHSA